MLQGCFSGGRVVGGVWDGDPMTTSVLVALVGGVLLGAAAGALVATLAARARAGSAFAERALLRERVTDLESAAAQDRELAATLSPLAGALQRVEEQVRTLERLEINPDARAEELSLEDFANLVRALHT